MKIVVIGGSGLVGSKLVKRLRQLGHEVVAASPASGVDTITGRGLIEALTAAQVVVDVANSPSPEDQAVLDFFETSGRNLLAAERIAGVRHHVALSVVGTDRLLESGYFRGKMTQEELVRGAGTPFTIVRSTQFFEFLDGIVQSAAVGPIVRVSPAYFQPIAADDVAGALADIAVGEPANGTLELAGPERMRLSDAVRRFLQDKRDERSVLDDPRARYFGASLEDTTLLPEASPRVGSIDLEDWLVRRPRGARPNTASSRVGHFVP